MSQKRPPSSSKPSRKPVQKNAPKANPVRKQGANAKAKNVAQSNVNAGKPKRRKRTKFLTFLILCAVLPIAAAVVFLQFFGDESQQLKSLDKNEVKNFLNNNVRGLIRKEARKTKESFDKNVAPVVEEKSREALAALKTGVNVVVEVAQSTMDKWGEEQKKLKAKFDRNVNMKNAYDEFEKKGVDSLLDDLSRITVEHEAPAKTQPQQAVSLLAGASYDEIEDNLSYAKRLVKRGASMKTPEEKMATFRRAADKITSARAYYSTMTKRVALAEDKKQVAKKMSEIDGLLKQVGPEIAALIKKEAKVKQVAMVEPKAIPPTKPKTLKNIAGKAPKKLVNMVKKKSAKNTAPSPSGEVMTKKSPKKSRPTPNKRAKGMVADKHFVKGMGKLTEGIEWYKKATPDITLKKRTKFLKQSMARLDVSLKSFVKVQDNKRYSSKKEQALLEKHMEKVMFLRYACMKSMTL